MQEDNDFEDFRQKFHKQGTNSNIIDRLNGFNEKNEEMPTMISSIYEEDKNIESNEPARKRKPDYYQQ